MECICDLQTHTSIYFQFSKFQSSSPWPMGPWWRSLAKQCFFRMMKLTSPVPVQTIAPCSSQDFTKFTCGKEISDIAFLWYIYLPNSRWQGDPAPSVCCQIGWWPYLPDRWWVGRDWKSCIPRVGSGFLTIAYITDTHTHSLLCRVTLLYIWKKNFASRGSKPEGFQLALHHPDWARTLCGSRHHRWQCRWRGQKSCLARVLWVQKKFMQVKFRKVDIPNLWWINHT